MTNLRRAKILDVATQMKDTGLVAASAAAQVSAANKILDLGPGFVQGDLVLDVTECEYATGDEKYEIEWQLSPDATFGTAANVRIGSTVKLGDSSVSNQGADLGTGRIVLPVTNEFLGTVYRYARLYTRIAGTIATGINYTAFLSKRDGTVN